MKTYAQRLAILRTLGEISESDVRNPSSDTPPFRSATVYCRIPREDWQAVVVEGARIVAELGGYLTTSFSERQAEMAESRLNVSVQIYHPLHLIAEEERAAQRASIEGWSDRSSD